MREPSVKVLHVIDSGGLYGAEMMLLNLAREQLQAGVFPCIASIGETGSHSKPVEIKAMEAGISVQPFRMKPGPNWIGASKIVAYAKKERFTILHSHGYKGNILLGALPKCIRKIPLVATIHGYTALSAGFSKMRVYEWLDQWILPRLDGVVLVNGGMLTHPAVRTIKKHNLHVIDNGIAEYPLKTSVLDPSIVQFCDFPVVIGAIGRLSHEKGFNILLDAFSRLVHGGIPARLVLMGDGRCRSRLVAQTERLNITHHVLMTGFLDNASMYLPLFTALVIPSLTEGLPIVLLEAMRAGTPVVATRVGGIPNVIENGRSGLVVEAGNAELLAENIRNLVTDEKLQMQIRKNAGNRFLKNYTSGTMARRYSALYAQVLGWY